MRACLYVALFTALVAVMESRAEAQTEPEIQKMLDAWKQRRKASGNIRYELKGEQMHPRHSGMSDLGGEAQNFDIRLKREYTIDWSTETGAYRLEGTVEDWDSDKKVAKQKQGISVFDGKTHRALLPKQKDYPSGYWGVIKGDLKSSELPDYFRFLMVDVGMPILNLDRGSLYHGSYLEYDPSDYADTLKVVSASANELKIKCPSKKSNNKEFGLEITCNPSQQYAVTRILHTIDKKPTRDSRYEYGLVGDVWRLKSIRSDSVIYKADIKEIQTYAVTAICPAARPDLSLSPESGIAARMVTYKDAGEKDAHVPTVDSTSKLRHPASWCRRSEMASRIVCLDY